MPNEGLSCVFLGYTITQLTHIRDNDIMKNNSGMNKERRHEKSTMNETSNTDEIAVCVRHGSNNACPTTAEP